MNQSYQSSAAYSGDPDTSFMSNQSGPSDHRRFSAWSEEKIATLQSRLARKLGPEYVTQRPGPGGGPKLRYGRGREKSEG
jgi:recombination DNA repair RAD52 pathway protein